MPLRNLWDFWSRFSCTRTSSLSEQYFLLVMKNRQFSSLSSWIRYFIIFAVSPFPSFPHPFGKKWDPLNTPFSSGWGDSWVFVLWLREFNNRTQRAISIYYSVYWVKTIYKTISTVCFKTEMNWTIDNCEMLTVFLWYGRSVLYSNMWNVLVHY